MDVPKGTKSPCGLFTFTRLNADSSWMIDCKNNKNENHTCRIILDPWIDDSPGIDGLSCFSSTWPHMESSITLDTFQKLCRENDPDTDSSLPESYDASTSASVVIVVSLPFSDHCHEETLIKTPTNIPIYAANGSYKRLARYFRRKEKRHIIDLSTSFGEEAFMKETGLLYRHIKSKYGFMDPTHRGILFSSACDENAILHAPHGLRLSPKQIQQLNADFQTICLLSTTKLFRLPLILGGTVNLGIENAQLLNQVLENVVMFLPTHSSSVTRVTGFVSYLAKIEHSSETNVEAFIPLYKEALPPKKSDVLNDDLFQDNR